MHIEEISWEKLDEYSSRREFSQITESSAWAQVLAGQGSKVKAMGLYNQGHLRSAWILGLVPVGLGMGYWYSPRLDFSALDPEEIMFAAAEMELSARSQGVVFWRFDPVEYFAIDDARPIPTISVQPERTLLIELEQGEDAILAGMHPKTRYNIRLAQKKGVGVRPAAAEDFPSWWELMRATVQRDGFRLHPESHYRALLQAAPGQIELWVAEYEGRIVCGNVIGCFGDTAAYLHGASGDQYRNVMAPYALQWHLMREAKRRGFRYYDLNGIDEDKWPGVTRFKRGFGGMEKIFPGTFDLAFNDSLYRVYVFLRKARRFLSKLG